MKNFFLTGLVISLPLLTSCGTTEMERRLEKNFVYQCSLKLFEDVDHKNKITGADAEKICTAAHHGEMDENAIKSGVAPTARPTVAPVSTPAPIAVKSTPTPSAPSSDDLDEVKPEPTPAKP